MFTACCPLILASASPRRHEYLTRLGLDFRIVPADIDEIFEPGESPRTFACRMAAAKARQVADAHPEACVIGADTVVALEHRIFGKPRDQEEALAMLMALQGRIHEVTTGVALVFGNHHIAEAAAVTTQVTFGVFTERTLRAYVASGEPMDKAGAYGIQGIGSFLVQSITGSCSNVVGLPVHAVVRSLLNLNLLKTG
jgi:septum formation protein